MEPLRFWLPVNRTLQEVLVPGNFIESVILPALHHEAGHIIAAHHFQGAVYGIAIALNPARSSEGLTFQAMYEPINWTLRSRCIVKAAGPAADLKYRGAIDEAGASGDIHDIEGLTGISSLGPYIEAATAVLDGHGGALERVVVELQKAITGKGPRYSRLLPGGDLGVVLVDANRLRNCLS
jgi:hypothetical protein